MATGRHAPASVAASWCARIICPRGSIPMPKRRPALGGLQGGATSSPMTDDVPATPQPANGCAAARERMRRSRQRRRGGLRCIPIEIHTSEVEALIAASLLDPVARNYPAAIGAALGKLLDRLSLEHSDAQTEYSRVCLRLSAGFIDRLVVLGWLPADCRRDRSVIKTALVGFTQRAGTLSLQTPVQFRA
jgi:hypothetical protein